jgi:hypothetical protein
MVRLAGAGLIEAARSLRRSRTLWRRSASAATVWAARLSGERRTKATGGTSRRSTTPRSTRRPRTTDDCWGLTPDPGKPGDCAHAQLGLVAGEHREDLALHSGEESFYRFGVVHQLVVPTNLTRHPQPLEPLAGPTRCMLSIVPRLGVAGRRPGRGRACLSWRGAPRTRRGRHDSRRQAVGLGPPRWS